MKLKIILQNLYRRRFERKIKIHTFSHIVHIDIIGTYLYNMQILQQY